MQTYTILGNFPDKKMWPCLVAPQTPPSDKNAAELWKCKKPHVVARLISIPSAPGLGAE